MPIAEGGSLYSCEAKPSPYLIGEALPNQIGSHALGLDRFCRIVGSIPGTSTNQGGPVGLGGNRTSPGCAVCRPASRRHRVASRAVHSLVRFQGHQQTKGGRLAPLGLLVHPTGIEPATSGFGGQRSIQLSYGYCSPPSWLRSGFRSRSGLRPALLRLTDSAPRCPPAPRSARSRRRNLPTELRVRITVASTALHHGFETAFLQGRAESGAFSSAHPPSASGRSRWCQRSSGGRPG